LHSHVVDNPDLDSEMQLLRAYAPSVSADVLQRLAASFGELRGMADAGTLAYPYSTREAR
jgi:hypothetical protein